MTGIERLRKLAKGDASHEIGNGWSLTAEMFESIADQIEHEIDEAVADEVADTLSAYEMNTNARWYSAVEDGADSDCNAEYELINRYWLPRPRFEDGEPVQLGDEYDHYGEAVKVEEIGYTWFKGDVAWHVKTICGPVWLRTDGPLKRPEPPDTWERIETDIVNKINPCVYFGWLDKECGEGGGCPGHGPKTNCSKARARDLVRRCKALAGIEVG